MNRKKKVVSSILICSLAFSLAACQSKSADTAAGGKSGNDSKKPITYNIFLNRGETQYPADGGEGKKLLLDAMAKSGITGVDFNVTMASGQDYYTKLNLLATSGDLPDYFSVDIPTMTNFAQQGLILPLDDYLKKMPHAAKVFDQAALDAGKYNGKIYSLPDGTRSEPINGKNVGGFDVRKDWLDNLGLKAPTTLDEYHDVLKAFTFNDPDKDGKKDTYGLGGVKPEKFGDTSGFDGVFGAFGIVPSFWFERDGKLKQGAVLPETKEALAVLQAWYKEGLIDPEFPVTAAKQRDEKVANSQIGMFGKDVWIINPTTPVNESMVKAAPKAKLIMLNPPKGPKGLLGWPEKAPGQEGMRAISAKVKNPDLLIKMLDWTTDDTPSGGFYLSAYGVEGKDYTYDKQKNRVDLKTPISDLIARGLSNPIQFIKVTDRRWSPEEVLDALAISNKYVIKNAFWKTVQAQLDYPDLSKLWVEYFVKIVTGEYSIDKWDEFVKNYYAKGGKQIEDQVNAEWKKSKK